MKRTASIIIAALAFALSASAQSGGGAASTPSSGGTVTSVGVTVPSVMTVSPSTITTSGTFGFGLASQLQNLFFASPNGSTGTPLFRAIVAADVPTLNQNTTGTAGGLSASIAESQVTNLVSDLAAKQANGNYITALTGDGTASGPGSVALTLATVNGSPGTTGDASHTSQITTNGKGLVTANTSVAIAIDAAAVTSGTSTVPRGGTGAGTFTAYSPLAAGTTATGPFQSIGTGSVGQVLFSQGSAALGQWATRSVNTSSPLSGGGSIGANLTIACATCATTTNGGALSATSPETISAAGVIACATCATTTNGGPLTASSPITVSAAGVIACATCSTAAAAQTVRVTSQFDKAADTTLADVPGLTANVTAGTSYVFRAVLNITADSAGLAQEAINGTCTGSPIWYIVKTNGNATFRSGKTATQGAGIAQVVSFNTVEIEGTVTVTVTGTLTVQFAQSVAVGTSSVLVGSSFIVTPASN